MKVSLDKKLEVIKLNFDYDNSIIKKVKTIPNRSFDYKNKIWKFPNQYRSFTIFLKLFKTQQIIFEAKINDFANPEALTKYFCNYYLNKFENQLILKGYSKNTIKAYLSHIRQFITYNKIDIQLLTIKDLNNYLLYLLEQKQNTHAFVNQFISAFKTFNQLIIKISGLNQKILRPKKKQKLPQILNQSEISRIISSINNLKHKLIIILTYSAGLRVSEVVKLKTPDIDQKRMLIYVRSAKGYKDRYTLLSKKALNILNLYLKAFNIEKQRKNWLFPGQNKDKHLSKRSAQKIFKKACKKANIKKQVGIHSLRHSFATHLLEQGVDLRYIQNLLGHKSSTTTEIYTHVSNKNLVDIVNPFDKL
ncbi:site-specific tyrosine recombinase/integron integrase [Halanaerobium salsuginis]|uniref:Site-specific recombinase XerD n=1 Tax=Halanaerobium salsuginis TaxID=29563 RepID=A0A1I4LDQ6_9FIRM|nr:site-specific tyrosine recombinase/integron integrase [Halanaerobium salsuginis]SFL89178.1 Site-specific recombinase XerD [Halanaerobium salsuginis]